MNLPTNLFRGLLILIAVFFINGAFAQEEQKAVLITGTSSGIGLRMTELLSENGFFVYAGARKQADLDRLNEMDNVQAIRLDVTKQDEIAAAVETIKKEGRGLYGLINNAGVAVVAPLIEVDEEDMYFQQEVNLFGPYRVTKAFAPMIMESKGRIITVGSISGILAGPLFGPYSISKHSMEAFTDALAAEMSQFGVEVSVIEPGNYNSKIGQNLVKRIQERNPSYENSLFKERMEQIAAGDGDRSQHKDPLEVAQAAMDALTSEKPKRRYMVVPNQLEAAITIRQIMREMVQLNQGQPYRYDREALINMLDEVMEEVEGSD